MGTKKVGYMDHQCIEGFKLIFFNFDIVDLSMKVLYETNKCRKKTYEIPALLKV